MCKWNCLVASSSLYRHGRTHAPCITMPPSASSISSLYRHGRVHGPCITMPPSASSISSANPTPADIRKKKIFLQQRNGNNVQYTRYVARLFVCLLFVCLFVRFNLFVCLLVCLFVCFLACLFVCLFVIPKVHIYLKLSVIRPLKRQQT